MAFQILMRRTLGGNLSPINDGGRDVISRIGDAEVLVEIRKIRNPAFHRKFFALISLIYHNQSRFRSIEELLDVIKVMVGHANVVEKDGKEIYIPKSISFAKMDELEFQAFYDRVITFVCEKIIPGVTREELERELLEFA